MIELVARPGTQFLHSFEIGSGGTEFVPGVLWYYPVVKIGGQRFLVAVETEKVADGFATGPVLRSKLKLLKRVVELTL